MVKGVNKNIIEINNTGSEIFERIIFFISPEYGNLTADSLQKATEEINSVISCDTGFEESLRNRVNRKQRRIKRFLVSAVVSLILMITAFFLIKKGLFP